MIAQGLEAETCATDMIKTKNSTYWSRNFSCYRVASSSRSLAGLTDSNPKSRFVRHKSPAQITLYTRGLKDSGHNQDIKLPAAISSKRVKEGKFLKDTASIEIRREVRKFSLETHV